MARTVSVAAGSLNWSEATTHSFGARPPARTLADFSGHYFPTFFRCFFRLLFRRFSERFLGHFGTLFSLIFHLFFLLKNDSFFYAFWDAFWMDFGGPDPRKLSSRLSETLILRKSPFSSQGRFLMQNGVQEAPKMEPKGHSKSMKKMMHFLIEQCIDF